MTAAQEHPVREASVASADGTPIGYWTLGQGPGLVVVGGVLSTASDYLPLAHALAREFEVHVMARRGRPGSGPQRDTHSIDDECADLAAVVAATGATAAFGHSFGGLVALETARRRAIFDRLFLYEPGVPLRGRLGAAWPDGYRQRLEVGDRRGAFAWMVKHAGFAPRPLTVMPVWYVKAVLRLAIRGQHWPQRIDCWRPTWSSIASRPRSTRPTPKGSRRSPPTPCCSAEPRAPRSSARIFSPNSPESYPMPPSRSSPA